MKQKGKKESVYPFDDKEFYIKLQNIINEILSKKEGIVMDIDKFLKSGKPPQEILIDILEAQRKEAELKKNNSDKADTKKCGDYAL